MALTHRRQFRFAICNVLKTRERVVLQRMSSIELESKDLCDILSPQVWENIEESE
jgi:hypothetical protein